MNKNSVPLYIGVTVSLIAIWLVNDYVLIDQCQSYGGRIDYHNAECVLKNGEIKTLALENYFMALYFFMGILISLFVSFSIRRIFNIKQ
jgi:hypothetical protein